jgi:SAM-dependent methyltransferase
MERTTTKERKKMPFGRAIVFFLTIIVASFTSHVDCWCYTPRLDRNFAGQTRDDVAVSSSSFSLDRRCKRSQLRSVHAKLTEAPSSGSASDVSIYNCPELYDLAFGYRDFESEVEFLLKVHQLSQDERVGPSSHSPLSVLELAAGPAQHAIEALANFGVSHATALDSSPSMARYAKRLLEEELERLDENDTSDGGAKTDIESRFDYVVGDMREFSLSRTYDTAWILLGSLQHLLTTDDVIRCFHCAYKVLKPGGTLVVELPHPQEVLGVVECTRNTWTVPLDCRHNDDDGDSKEKLVIVWGDEDDPLDPLTQVRDFTVEFQLHGCAESEWKRLGLASPTLHQVVPMRLFTAGEMEALARCAGFRIAAMYGALEPENLVDIGDDELAFRMVCVLQKA